MPLTKYAVRYADTALDAQDNIMLFLCEAEDREHAREQCLNAYPGCTIVTVNPQ